MNRDAGKENKYSQGAGKPAVEEGRPPEASNMPQLSRRTLLATAGAAGAALIASASASALPGGVLGRGPDDRMRVTGQVYGGNDPLCPPVQWINVLCNGATGDGVADEIPPLSTLLMSISGQKEVLYFPKGVYRFGSNLSFPRHLRLVLDRGAVLAPDAGVTLTVDASLWTGLHLIFGGQGQIAGSLGEHRYYPQWWGAAADGTADDAPAINRAVRAASDAGGGTVYLAKGVYRLATVTGSNKALIVPKSRVNIVGEGDESVLKPADGLNGPPVGGWNVIYPPDDTPANRVDQVLYRDFKVDCNGVNNLQKSYKNAAIGIRHGADIAVERVTVANNPGRQCFMFGGNLMPHSIERLAICHCVIHTVGTAVPGNTVTNDHSSIYAQANGCIIEHNQFYNPVEDLSTAIELHSSNTIVANNVITNYRAAFNVVATVTDHVNTLFTGNVCKGVLWAAYFWCYEGMKMSDVRLFNNMFEQRSTPELDLAMVDLNYRIRAPIERITVADNHFIGTAGETDSIVPAIRIGDCRTLVIRNNRFHRTIGRAIDIQKIVDNENTFLIEGNEFVDCCQTTNTQHKLAIQLNNSRKIKRLTIKNNVFVKTETSAVTAAIGGSASLGCAEICGNSCDQTVSDIVWHDSATIDLLLLEHTGTSDPEGLVRASPGSRWLNPLTGDVWHKRQGGSLKTGWQLDRSAGGPPASGTFRVGDTVRNTSPVPGGPIGWVCTTAGSPGVFKSFGDIEI